MLKHFNAALSRLWEARSLDYLADLAEACLGAAVMIVAGGNRASIIAAGERVRSAGVDPPDAGGALLVPGEGAELLGGVPTGFPPPFERMLAVPLGGGGRAAILRIFPVAPGVSAERIAAVAPVLAAAIAESEAAERQRADLLRFANILEQMERVARIGVWEFDIASGALFWSDEVFRIHDLVPGRTPTVRESLEYYPEPARSQLHEAFRQTVTAGVPFDLILPFVTAADVRRMVRVVASRETDVNGTGRVAGVFQDVTTQEEITERLRWTANHDILTGLPNRGLFAEQFGAALERAERRACAVALVLVDVDKFKSVNDTLGHAAGDELLRLVARHLQDAVRDGDTVARTGGDEFSILLDGVGAAADVEARLARLREALAVRLVSGEQTMLVTMSAGAAVAPDHARNGRELFSAADLALYRAKGSRRGALVVFDPSLGEASGRRDRLLAAVREALDEGRIVPFYRPQVDVVSGRIVGVEAVARWIDDAGVRPAADVLEALSDHDIGDRIGAAVVDRALADVAALNARRRDKIALSLDASAGEIAQIRFVERVGKACRREPVQGPVAVEIAEDVIPDDPDGGLGNRLDAARTAGRRVPFDDFGAGASPVHVSTLPVPEVRIDRRVLVGLGEDTARQKLVRGMIEFARSLGIRVIVEGIETRDEAEAIVALGGRTLQDFHCSRAVPVDEIRRLLVAETRRLHEAA